MVRVEDLELTVVAVAVLLLGRRGGDITADPFNKR